MKTVCEKDMCMGCYNCVSVCPKKCINVEETFLGYNAYILENQCVSCGLCSICCPQKTSPTPYLVSNCFSSKDPNKNEYSSSGGIGAFFVKEFLKDGAVVCSVFDKNDQKIKHILITNEEDIERASGSKYAKSDTSNVVSLVNQVLINDNKKLLFIGTPCQVAAVRLYATYKKIDENLLAIELICHGSPTSKHFEKVKREEKIANVSRLLFRQGQSFGVFFDSKPLSGKKSQVDYYTLAFLHSLNYAESCYSCKYASNSRVGDITIGDDWSKQGEAFSCVFLNSKKGNDYWNRVNNKLVFQQANIELMKKTNKQLNEPSHPHKKRQVFLSLLYSKPYKKVVKKCLPKETFRQFLKGLIK